MSFGKLVCDLRRHSPVTDTAIFNAEIHVASVRRPQRKELPRLIEDAGEDPVTHVSIPVMGYDSVRLSGRIPGNSYRQSLFIQYPGEPELKSQSA